MSDDGEERILVTYERMLEADMQFECMECGKRFYHKSNLSNHMRTHADRNALKCDVCSKGFFSEADLHDHSRLEHGELVHFVCHLCRQTFSQKSQLRAHLSTHSTEAPYACELCGQTFPKKIRLKQHYRSHKWVKKPCTAKISRPQGADDDLEQFSSEVVQLD